MLKTFKLLTILFLLHSCSPEINCVGIPYPKVKHPEMMEILKKQDQFTLKYIEEIKAGNKQTVYPQEYSKNHERIMEIIANEFDHDKLGLMADYQKATARKVREIDGK